MRIYYRIETLDPVIISQGSATTNNHDCLGFIPGSVILGAMAGRLYQKLGDELAWQAFHAGQCRFSNCYPLLATANQSEITLPLPASWHGLKGKDLVTAGKYHNQIGNHAAVDFDYQSGLQYQQIGPGFVSANGHKVDVKRDTTGKTAINNKTGVAAEAQLFNYAYIESGQCFGGWIDCQNPQIAAEIQGVINGLYRLGRSRNAEFGRVQLQPITLKTTESEIFNHPEQLVIWCLSDCEIFNQQGMPTLHPQGCDIHPRFKGANLDLDQSYIRRESASRFNQKRQGVDSEQIMIGMGSVLVFKLQQPLSDDVLKTITEQGVGANRQQGLGWVYLNPPWANNPKPLDKPLFEAIKFAATASPAESVNVEPQTSLLAWVNAKVDGNNQDLGYQEAVRKVLAEICQNYRRARTYNGWRHSQKVGPSANQWSRIFELVRFDDPDWAKAAFVGENAICKAKNDPFGWGVQWHDGNIQTDFAATTEQLLRGKTGRFMRLMLEQLSRFDLSEGKDLRRVETQGWEQ